MRRVTSVVALVLAACSSIGADQATDPSRQWGSWRGPLNNGVAPHGTPPVEWSEDKNVRWKVALPGLGHSTPVIWGNRVFLTSAEEHGDGVGTHTEHDAGAHDNLPATRHQRFIVLAIDRGTGEIVWKRTVRDERPHEGAHATGSWASNSPVTDGEHLFAFFGSRGLYALDLNGELLWDVDLGDMQSFHGHGEGSSPALYGDTLVVNWDHQGESFVIALDKRTGKPRWKTMRDEITSWSTPLIVEHAGKQQVVVSATKRVRAYDLATGKQLWQCGGLSRNVVASPVAADGLVFVGNSYDWQAMMAIRLSSEGDVTGTDAVVWKQNRHTPYVPSPLLYGEMLCYLKHNQALLTCLEAKTGKTIFGPQRLPGVRNVFASPVGASDRIYIADRDGSTLVIKRGESFEVLATNHLDDGFSASPAIAGDALFLRGEHHLYCLAEGNAKSVSSQRP